MKKRGNFKNFLKPSLIKVILALVFLVLAYLFLSVPCKVGAFVPNPPQATWSFCRLQYSPLLSNILYSILPNYSQPIGVSRTFLGIRFGGILSFLIVLALSYLLSSLLVSLILKKKKTK